MTWPTGAHACECAACHRGFVSVEAFDRHRRPGRVCLEPSSLGMWLATDDMWSTYPRSETLEHAARNARGITLQRTREGVGERANSDAHPETT